VVFFQRKPYPTGHYSLEAFFSDLRRRLEGHIEARVVKGRFYSRGFFRRLAIGLEAAFRQGEVNVVAGDIHFVTLFLSGRRTLLMIPDCGFLHFSKGIRRFIEKWFWLSLPVWRASRVVTISEFCRQEIIQNAPCDPEKVIVIPVAIGEHFVYTPRPFRTQRPVLLQVGQSPNKNIPRIIRAIQGMDVRLVMIGELAPENARMLEACGIDYVSRCNLTDEEVFWEYVNCDALIFPSLYEGFGMPILEAQAVGRPVITSDRPPMTWVSGGAACLVDPFSVDSIRQGIAKVLGDEAYRQDLVTRGLINVRRFRPDAIARQYLEQIRMILAGQGATTACAP
jgi:glycosyltransferase involved in cell wall biosynthesis